ncbi:MAG: pyruvate dehydrogenase complex dihydrolipoamide acetyltransferase [Parachlamydiales bacterium]
MVTPFTMPKLSPTMEEGQIVRWLKKEGEFVEAGEALLEIATDKATVEHNAIDEGYLRKILIPDGQTAAVNVPIALFTETKEENIESYQPEKPAAPKIEEEKKEEVAPPPPKKTGALAAPTFAPEPPLSDYRFLGEPPMRERVLASPAAKKIAKEMGLDITTVKGSGPNGRVMKKDLERAQKAGPVAFGRHVAPKEAPGSYEEETLTPMRKTVGQRLQQSKMSIPHFYVTQEIDASAMVTLHEQLKATGVKVSYNDLIVRATALTLREVPQFNTGYNSEKDTIIHFKTIDISIAVSLGHGLITPILRHADYKNLGQISTEIRSLAKRAREGKLKPEEYKGGSFTISNLGMYGVTDFVAVINPPQSGILAVSGIRDVPVVKNGQVVPGKVMQLTLAADHRVVDGVDGAIFLQKLKEFLENPAVLLV